ncbi:hypothetical protein MUU77_12105 [Pseudoxanthomonas sp. F37]|uniref:hypothetical protein n=1 Tax=Pseudoxanthomonas sp. F37 TaxID=2932492 RepID=UPI001FD07723|nr:hypothetical protein [Pseudoxanthomonas sp. F37]UOV07595.1 hypothetical protein MUU77_12105 [Pseudoxanthomonas sp. F37]
MDFAYHPSLKKTLKECQEWLTYPSSQAMPERYSSHLQEWMAAEERPARMRGNPVDDLGHYYGIAACDAYKRKCTADLARLLRWAVAFRALDLRRSGMFSEQYPGDGDWPSEFSDSMKAASVLTLSEWALGRICVERFIQMAEKDQRVNQPPATRRINHSTHDVFLIDLFAQAFDLTTSFRPCRPLIEPYQQLLDAWHTEDESIFRSAMQAAADFHISRAKASTGRTFYEFNYDIDRLFPAELLAVQALRRRDGLPAFEAGHLLVDGPWAVIKDLPDAEPHPLTVRVEAQLHRDYPDFR